MDIQDDTVHSSIRFYRRCYSVDQTHLKRVIGVMKARTQGDIDISLFLDDTDSISGTSLDVLLESSVLDAHNISEVRLHAKRIQSNDLTSMNIHYRKSDISGAIRVSITGRSDAVVAAREDIERLIQSVSRKFWPLNYKGSAVVFLLYLIPTGCLGIYASAFFLVALGATTSLKEYPNAFGALFTFLCILFAVMIWSIRDTLFPVMEFRVGKSGLAADRRDAIRKYIFVTAIGGLILSFAGRIIWDQLAAFTVKQP